MHPFLSDRLGNPSSIHAHGQAAARAIDVARRQVRDLAGGPAGDIIFTGSGSEAVLLGVVGAARAAAPRGGHVVMSAVEHRAGRDASDMLEALGFGVSLVYPEADGNLDPAKVLAAVLESTVLVSIMHANNETGVVHPVEPIAAALRARGVLMHVDAVQSAGKIPLRAEDWGVAYLSLAAHKLGGPQGVGALWRRRGSPLVPILPGPQESALRGGTQNTPGIVGFGWAAQAASAELDSVGPRMLERRRRFKEDLHARVPTVRVTGSETGRLPNTVHMTFDPAVGSDLVVALDLAGYAVSAGSACSSGSEEASPVLMAMGFPRERARTAVRVSFGAGTSEEELGDFVLALAGVVEQRLRSRVTA